jgi:hypothetical protein
VARPVAVEEPACEETRIDLGDESLLRRFFADTWPVDEALGLLRARRDGYAQMYALLRSLDDGAACPTRCSSTSSMAGPRPLRMGDRLVRTAPRRLLQRLAVVAARFSLSNGIPRPPVRRRSNRHLSTRISSTRLDSRQAARSACSRSTTTCGSPTEILSSDRTDDCVYFLPARRAGWQPRHHGRARALGQPQGLPLAQRARHSNESRSDKGSGT